MLGRILADRFRIERVAGVGGMGTVFQAVDLTSGTTVAVKLVDGASDVERFLQEAEVLAQLDHPAIVKYVSHGQSDHGPFLAMEWLEGEDLASRLARGRVAAADAATLVERVASALAYLIARTA